MTGSAPAAARLRWLCRRGSRELDLLLQGFLERGYPALSSLDKARFRDLLEENDPDIYAWVVGRAKPANPGYQALVDAMRKTATGDASRPGESP